MVVFRPDSTPMYIDVHWRMNRVIHPTFLTSDPGGHVVVGQSGLLPQRSEVDATRVQLVQDRTRRGFAPRRLLQHGDRDLVLRIGLGYHVALLRLEAVNVLGCQFERAPLVFLTLRLTSNRDMVERSRPKRSAIVTVESPSSMYHFFASFTSVGRARYTPPVWDTPRKWATAHLLGVYDRLCENTSFRDTPELAEAYSRRLSPHGGGVYSCAPNLRLGHLQPRHGE